MIIIGIYGKLTMKKNKIEDKYNYINKYLEERINLILRIINLLEPSTYHEENLTTELEKLTKEITKEKNINNSLKLISKSNKLITKALTLEKIYKELATNQNYNLIKEEFANNQSQITYAIEIYNEEVNKYEEYRKKPVIKHISKLLNFKDYETYYQ